MRKRQTDRIGVAHPSLKQNWSGPFFFASNQIRIQNNLLSKIDERKKFNQAQEKHSLAKYIHEKWVVMVIKRK